MGRESGVAWGGESENSEGYKRGQRIEREREREREQLLQCSVIRE
jgi:hypothetical protein